MRVLGHMVVKNEADRYLAAALSALVAAADEVAVFDNRSDDNTVEIARSLGAVTVVREPDEPSFEEHEGRYRNVAWRWMEAVLRPDEGDWILVIDADQILTGPAPRAEMIDAIMSSDGDTTTLVLPVDELWSVDPPRRRTDGFWGQSDAACLYRWTPGQEIPDKPLACGSIPRHGPRRHVQIPRIAHLGYVRPEDRVEKYERYYRRPGHNPGHIASILDRTPTLEPYPEVLHV